MRIAYAGTPEFAVPALAALVGSRHSVVGVLTQPDRPKGRGRRLTPSPVKLAALEQGIPISQPQTLRDEASRADLAGWRPDVLVVVAYGLILSQAVLDLPPLGCINIHASLLPRWRGAAPIQRAVMNGDPQTGVTIMRMDAGLDTGPILLQEVLAISESDTSATLHDSLSRLGSNALLKALEGLESGAIQPRAQPSQSASYAAKIDKSEAVIDWTRSAEAIARMIRAFNPWPIAETCFDGEQLRIHEASAEPTPSGAPSVPGTLAVTREGEPIVVCGSGVLRLVEVQRPGRRAISGRDLANTPDLAGRRLG